MITIIIKEQLASLNALTENIGQVLRIHKNRKRNMMWNGSGVPSYECRRFQSKYHMFKMLLRA